MLLSTVSYEETEERRITLLQDQGSDYTTIFVLTV